MQARHETGMLTIDYPKALQEAVYSTAEEWQKFCLLDEGVQDIFTASSMFNGVGFERKVGTGELNSRLSHDKKLNFDITQQSVDALEAKVLQVDSRVDRKIADSFIQSASALTHLASTAIENYGEKIEATYTIDGFHELAAKSAPNAFFRTIYYPPTKDVGEIIGEPHVDNSGFTLHLFESTDGCEALASDRQSWYPMPVSQESALAFPSMQTQLQTGGEIDGLCHRIIANETTQKIGRYAIVCFVPLNGVSTYDRKRHGRLQEKSPGFNYRMPAEEFGDLFVPNK